MSDIQKIDIEIQVISILEENIPDLSEQEGIKEKGQRLTQLFSDVDFYYSAPIETLDNEIIDLGKEISALESQKPKGALKVLEVAARIVGVIVYFAIFSFATIVTFGAGMHYLGSIETSAFDNLEKRKSKPRPLERLISGWNGAEINDLRHKMAVNKEAIILFGEKRHKSIIELVNALNNRLDFYKITHNPRIKSRDDKIKVINEVLETITKIQKEQTI